MPRVAYLHPPRSFLVCRIKHPSLESRSKFIRPTSLPPGRIHIEFVSPRDSSSAAARIDSQNPLVPCAPLFVRRLLRYPSPRPASGSRNPDAHPVPLHPCPIYPLRLSRLNRFVTYSTLTRAPTQDNVATSLTRRILLYKTIGGIVRSGW